MLKMRLLLASMLLSYTGYCQTTAPAFSSLSSGSTTDGDDEYRYVSKQNFPNVFNQHISYILTGDKNLSSLGNYFSVNPAKPTATVAFAAANYKPGAESDAAAKKSEAKYRKIRYIISGNLSGGVADNLVSVFKNDRFSTSIDGRINGSWICNAKFFYYKKDKEELKISKDGLGRSYDFQISNDALARKKVKADIAVLEKKRDDIINGKQNKVALPNEEDLPIEDRIKLTELRYKDAEPVDAGIKLIVKKTTDSLKSLELNANWSSIRLVWIDGFLQAKQQKIYLYEETNPLFSKRITENDFTGYKMGLGVNFYWDSQADGWRWLNGLLRIEYGYSRNNNISELSPMDISTVTKTDSFNIARTITEKVSAYKDSKYTKNYYHDMRLDVIKKLSSQIALHVNYNLLAPFAESKNFTKPLYGVNNITAGFIFAFANKDDKKSKLNVEPYIRLRDLANKYDSEFKRTFQRNEIGVYLTLPLAYRLGRATDK